MEEDMPPPSRYLLGGTTSRLPEQGTSTEKILETLKRMARLPPLPSPEMLRC